VVVQVLGGDVQVVGRGGSAAANEPLPARPLSRMRANVE
jgi:hypothetical protein